MNAHISPTLQRSLFLSIVFAVVLVIAPAPRSFAQSIFDVYEVKGKSDPKTNRKRGIEMLHEIRETIEKYYYDKNFRGIDLGAKFKEAEGKIATLDTNSDIFRVIAATVLEFRDSHTRFIPPARTSTVEYGFATQMIGNDCVVTFVKKGSDAEAKGLKPGDVVAAFGRFAVTRDNFWEISYNIYSLSPLNRLRLTLKNDDGSTHEVIVHASFSTIEQRKAEAEKRQNEKRADPYKCVTISPELAACRLETFAVTRGFIDRMMTEANKYKKLIIDLRGNRGGYVMTEEYLVGHFFRNDIKIGTTISRKKSEDRIARPQQKHPFYGELIVLVDSNSASAAEVFARVIQLEHRGKIVGDVTAGAVMTSWYIPNAGTKGSSAYYVYAVNVTVADLIMSDGNRLENVGVVPDHLVGPTREALLGHTDPVLAYAASLLNVKLTPQDAGKYHFLKSRFEDDEDETETESGNDN